MQLKKEFEDVLSPFGKLVYEIFKTVWRISDIEKLNLLKNACDSVSETNCGWTNFTAAKMIQDEVIRLIQNVEFHGKEGWDQIVVSSLGPKSEKYKVVAFGSDHFSPVIETFDSWGAAHNLWSELSNEENDFSAIEIFEVLSPSYVKREEL